MISFNFTKYENDIFRSTKEIGCCLLCCYRFCGVNLLEFLKNLNNSEIMLEQEQNFDEFDIPLLEPCVICLGILQNSTVLSFINNMKNKSDILDYDCPTVSFNFTLPVSIQIREEAVRIYLSENVIQSSNVQEKYLRVHNIKDVFKWYLTYKVKQLIKKQIDNSNVSSPFSVNIFMTYTEDDKECTNFIFNYKKLLKTNALIHSTKNISKKTVDIVLNSLSDEQFKECFVVPPKIPTKFIKIEKITTKHSSIFIGSRYIKTSRLICQTPWLIDGKYKMTTSVQQLISNVIIEYTKSDSAKFLSSGREDVDVRMLSSGRPFAVELINPKVTRLQINDLKLLFDKVNSASEKVKLTENLKIMSRYDLQKIKAGEYSKSKSYRALCILKKNCNQTHILKKINKIQNLKIVQNTPLRVLHRRAYSARERTVYELRARYPNERELKCFKKCTSCFSNDIIFVILDFKTQAGTYIKEFVHGDFGRTMPNLCYLLETQIDILALDVTNIDLEWP